ncbi:MAG: GNAT family N-acetyltransferase [Luteolibacter sp.]|uniref:GNAT family N-acetyltransferase n=1 Tax=Luteolibacter sp. TaxID=1962973 RepID=UPI00326654F4
MLDHHTIAVADAYWASHFGCVADELFSGSFHLITHGGELIDYCGVFAIFRGGKVTVSIPPDQAESLRGILSDLTNDCSPDSLASALEPVATRVIGPAYIGYASAVSGPSHPVRSLSSNDVTALMALEQSCDTTEWEHGGSPVENPCSGVFSGEKLVAVAGYEIWGGSIAHISIITHPDFRNQGFGRSAVAHLAVKVIQAGLLPQYRTLESNRSSIRIAESLGFQHYATSMAVRITR